MSETTLRDTLTQAVETQEAPETDTRVRDEHGRFAKTAPEHQEIQNVEKDTAVPENRVPSPQEPIEQLQRPSSWKKEMWPVWDKVSTGQPLTPEESRLLAKYNLERESQFASGVSTYREEAIKAKELQQEVERSRSLNQALAPFLPDLQQNNINPAQWITNLGQAHSMLVKGTPEQKAAMFVQLLKDYQPPLDLIFSRGQDGSLYLNQNLQVQRQQPDVRETVKEMLEQERMNSLINDMRSNTEKYPHFEAVREKMAGLLQTGLAPDLESAYAHALRLDDELWQATQQQQTEEAERQRQREEAERVAKARASAVSPKGATPIGTTTGGKKGLRDTLEEQVAAVLGGGRV